MPLLHLQWSVAQLPALSHIPLHDLIKRHISESILQGELPADTIVPSESSLAHKFDNEEGVECTYHGGHADAPA